MSVTPAEINEADSIQWQIPEEFYSLGLELGPADRAAYLDRLAAELWATGTEYQRQTVSNWYQQIAEAVAQDGALEAAFCAMRIDERITTATLSIMARPFEVDTEISVTIAGLLETLSVDSSTEVTRVDTKAGPAVLSLSAMQLTQAELEGETGNSDSLIMAQAVAYLPLPSVSQLFVLTLSTPSIEDLPDYIGVLARITDTVQVRTGELTESDTPTAMQHDNASQKSIRDVFG
ncbi:hypothetical protein [Streptomyces sp. NPDC003077]|uniref:hypothetical protein n=1 Tax=Streptomyces sp. NPDC003077 TaxID=3154443 RepID=UPI0033B80BC5